MYSSLTWKSTPRKAPEFPAEWVKFRHYLDQSVNMTPQGRTDLNNTLKHYEHMVKMDAKTQDCYEREISSLQRQINDLSAKLQLADASIKKSMEDDEETPLPLLHMMERTAVAEKKYEDLQRDIIGAVIDCPDYCAVCDIGYDLWQSTCPPKKDKKTKDQIRDYMMDDVIEKNDLTTEDDFGDAYDNGYNAGKEEAEEYYDDQIDTLKEELSANQAILETYRDEMTKIEELAGTEVEDIVDVAGYIKCLQEALKIVKDENEVNKKNMSIWQTKCQEAEAKTEELKGKFRKDLEEMAEQMTIPLKKELAEAKKETQMAVLEGEFNTWREKTGYQQDVFQEGQFLLDYAPCKEMAREFFNDYNADVLDESRMVMNDQYEVVEMYEDDDGEYTLTFEEWEKNRC